MTTPRAIDRAAAAGRASPGPAFDVIDPTTTPIVRGRGFVAQRHGVASRLPAGSVSRGYPHHLGRVRGPALGRRSRDSRGAALGAVSPRLHRRDSRRRRPRRRVARRTMVRSAAANRLHASGHGPHPPPRVARSADVPHAPLARGGAVAVGPLLLSLSSTLTALINARHLRAWPCRACQRALDEVARQRHECRQRCRAARCRGQRPSRYHGRSRAHEVGGWLVPRPRPDRAGEHALPGRRWWRTSARLQWAATASRSNSTAHSTWTRRRSRQPPDSTRCETP